MKRLNPEYIEAVKSKVNRCPYFTLLSMELKDMDWGRSLLEVRIDNKHLQPYGVVHGGVFASILDASAFWAMFTELEEGINLTTVELKINYLAPASDGILIAEGRSIKIGRTLCLGDATIRNKHGKILAHGTETAMIIKGLKFDGEEDLPPKYI